MLILRQFPDVWPCTPANAAFRQRFYARWGREHAIVRGRAARISFPPFTQCLSIKAAWGGGESYHCGTRRLRVDDDCWLVLNEGRTYGSEIAELQPTDSLAVFFAPGFSASVTRAAQAPWAAALDTAHDDAASGGGFDEHLHPHDGAVSPLLHALRDAVDDGESDPWWFDEQMQLLLEAMLAAQQRTHALADRVHAARAITRAELRRRVARAADLIQCAYAEPLTLDDLAAAAGLSKFHLVRLFRAIYGTTPHAALQRKRVRVARRLLDQPGADLTTIAVAVGFGTRFTLFRQLRRHYGASGVALRRLPEPR